MTDIRAEVLAPAGSYESMIAAINAGADAVYMGGSAFGARAYADNPDENGMLNAIDHAHLYNKKLYLTVNTLIKEKEFDSLYEYMIPYYLHGLDAAIVQDMGVFAYFRKIFPDLALHASTQMTVTGLYGAEMLKGLGATRIVPARELSLSELSIIHDNVDIEIESFVHGALCYCYSGQCLLSSLIGGRSGNRGRCAQPCRLPYDVLRHGDIINKGNSKYMLSLKDLCTLDIIPDILEAGVYSLKIEGRMKSPRYTAGVVSMYRKYVDKYFKNGREGYYVDPDDKKMLLELFDRGGFTNGFYNCHNSKDMVAVKEKPVFREGNQNIYDYIDKTYINCNSKLKINGTVTIEPGKPVVLCASYNGISYEAYSAPAEYAKKQPLTEAVISKQIRKTGASEFEWDKLEIIVKGDAFLPVFELNELRRKAIDGLKGKILCAGRRREDDYIQDAGTIKLSLNQNDSKEQDRVKINVMVEETYQLDAVLEFSEVSDVYIESTGFSEDIWKISADKCHEAGKKCILVLPHIFRNETAKYFDKYIDKLKTAGFDALLLKTLEEAEYLAEKSILIKVIYDASIYTFNRMAADFFASNGAYKLTYPLELNSREIGDLNMPGQELIVYGRLPVMVSASCIKRTSEKCTHIPETVFIRDRKNKEFPVKNHCRFCYNTIYNSIPLSLITENNIIKHLMPSSVRLQFTTESTDEMKYIIKNYINAFYYDEVFINPVSDFTRGHFKRGVE